MTIKIPKPSMADSILTIMGKKRAVFVSTDHPLRSDVDAYQIAKYESFWVALLRPKSDELPDGKVYPDGFLGK